MESQNRGNRDIGVFNKRLSRRHFLKYAGLAGATIGVGSGLGGLLAACGSDADQTAMTAGRNGGVSTTGGTDTDAQANTTIAGAEAEMGDEIKVGFVSPLTGQLAPFGIPDKYCSERWTEFVGDGLICGDGKKHPIKIMIEDSQSDSNRAAQVAGDLINNSGIHLMMVASTPDTVTPTVEQCEAYGTPVVSTDCPWQTYMGKSMDTGYKWSYHAFRGGEDMIAVVAAAVASVETNRVCGFHMPNDADGNFYHEVEPPELEKAGLQIVDGGLFENHSEDFSAIISIYRKAGCEVVVSNMTTPDFTNFWKQCKQQGFNPKVCFVTKGVMFPQAVDALGDLATGLLCDVMWHQDYPFETSLTGESCAELAADFEKRTGNQVSNVLCHYVIGEMAVYALQKAQDPLDKESILTTIETMVLPTSILGPIDFTAPIPPKGANKVDYFVGPGRKTKNVYGTGEACAQWRETEDNWSFTQVLVGNAAAPFVTKVEAVQPMTS